LRVGLFESGAGWMPWLVSRLDDAYSPGSSMTPNLKRRPSEILAEGRLFCSFDPDEEFMGYCVEQLGPDVWLMGTDYPHQGSSFPEGVPQIVERKDLPESAKVKIVSENALRMCPRFATWAAPTTA
jgi:predicted TIM-barrel fold metal-dependent hydrolase